jgi:hypothetical protein
MKRFIAAVLLCLAPFVHAAMAHLELQVVLDPGTRVLQARAQLTTTGGERPPLSLNPLFKVSSAQWDAAAHRLSVAYAGTLPPMPASAQRNAPVRADLFASPDGSYLAPNALWYPDPGGPFTYRIGLSLPAGQKGLAPGTQQGVSDSQAGFKATYAFDHPAEGIWLMAGPYQVAQTSFVADGGQRVTVRTWFHPELAALAQGYLGDSVKYLQRYSRAIGPYPFGDFSIVSSPLSHGLGMPSLTYLGRDVLRLPFIRATSLGHEVLHNWWGNGVYPEWSSGNWSEGLTTFMADYAYQEDESPEAARAARLAWLRDLLAVAPADETALAAFTARHHGISSVIGYGKAAMVFFMLRDEIGPTAFEQGLRLFWQRHQFRTAGWPDLQAAFAHAAGRDLSGFFAQWVRRAASPRLALQAAAQGGIALVQQGEPFDLLVPLRVRLASGATRDMSVRARDRETPVDAGADATQVELDPDRRLWRRLAARDVPPILRDVFIAPRAQLLVAGPSAQWRGPANALAQRLLDNEPVMVGEEQLRTAPDVPALVLGDAADIARLLPRLGIAAVPDEVRASGGQPTGRAQAWTARAANGKTFAFVAADSPQALAGLQRALPHYGRQSWLVFEDGRMVGQGTWPVTAQALVLGSDRR